MAESGCDVSLNGDVEVMLVKSGDILGKFILVWEDYYRDGNYTEEEKKHQKLVQRVYGTVESG